MAFKHWCVYWDVPNSVLSAFLFFLIGKVADVEPVAAIAARALNRNLTDWGPCLAEVLAPILFYVGVFRWNMCFVQMCLVQMCFL